MISVESCAHTINRQGARTDSDNITDISTERGRQVRRQVLMSLLVTVFQAIASKLSLTDKVSTETGRTVFGDVVEVVPADDDGAGHLRGHDTACQDATADGNFTSEGAFLIYRPQASTLPIKHPRPCAISRKRTNVGAANGIRGRLEAQADILVPPLIFGRDLLSNCTTPASNIRTFHRMCNQGCFSKTYLTRMYAPRVFVFWKRGCFWKAFSI